MRHIPIFVRVLQFLVLLLALFFFSLNLSFLSFSDSEANFVLNFSLVSECSFFFGYFFVQCHATLSSVT